jgi:hypothetical protein
MYDADSRRGRYFGGRQGARMSVCVKVFGPGAMSDLNLFSAPKRTSADQSELMGSRPGWSRISAAHRHEALRRVRDTRNVLAAEW